MKAKQATFDLLESYPFDTGFSLLGLTRKVADKIDRPNIYPGTICRYLREYRAKKGISIPCIHKLKSMYKKERVL